MAVIAVIPMRFRMFHAMSNDAVITPLGPVSDHVQPLAAPVFNKEQSMIVMVLLCK